jgi:hypothetical protein
MSPWKSVSVLVVAALALAACGVGAGQRAAEDAAKPPASPDPCDLVAPTTIADVVGPSLPMTVGGFGLPDKTSASCSWSFGLKVDAIDDVVRPQQRQLSVDAQTWKADPCTEVKPSAKAVATPGLGDEAVLDLSVKGGTLTFCREHRLAKITWWAVDSQNAKAVTVPDTEYEKTLLRVGREVLDRWAEADAVKLNDRMPERSTGPKPPVACTLVDGRTLETLDVDTEDRQELGSPEQGSTECIWRIREHGREPGEPINRHLSVDIQSYGTEFGHRGTERASTAARAFSHGWQVAADSKLGGGAIVKNDDDGYIGMAASGAFTVYVVLRAQDIGWTEQKPAPSDATVAAWTRQVMTEVLGSMPR